MPFPAGGATDLFARTLSQKMGEKLGTTLVIDNKPGAGGAIGSTSRPRRRPTATRCCWPPPARTPSARAINAKLPYDTVRDFTPIAHVGDAPSIMLVPNSSPAKTVREWIDYAKKNPGKLNYASSGNGTIVQLTAELFKSQAGVFVTHIPYKGTALAIPDLISGKIDVLFDSLPTGMPHVRDGRLRALGVTALKRSPLAPELPAIADVLPGFESNTWFGLYGPRPCRRTSWRASTRPPTRRWPIPRCATSCPSSASRRPPARRRSSRAWWRRTPRSGRRSSPNARSPGD